MVDKKLTEITEATTVADTDFVHSVISGFSRKVQKRKFFKSY